MHIDYKTIISSVLGLVSGFFAPILPYAALCSAMVMLDWLSAVALGRRLKKKRQIPEAGKLSSRRFGKLIVSLIKIYTGLIVASCVQTLIIEGLPGGFDAVRFVTAVVCFWQLLSILENESTCSDARWAAIARRYLADKTRRHTGIDL